MTAASPPTTARGADGEILAVAKGGGLKFSGRIFFTAGNIAAGIILTRFLGATQFGLYRLALTLTEMLSLVCLLGLDSSTDRFLPVAAREKNEGKLQGILLLTLGIPVAVGAVCAVGAILAADWIANVLFEAPELAGVLRIMSVAIPLGALLLAAEAVARAFQRVDFSVYGMDIAYPASRVILTLIVLLAGFGLAGAAGARVAAAAVAAFLLLGLVHRLFPFTRPPSLGRYPFRSVLRQSLPVSVSRMFQVFNGRLEIFILGFFGMVSGVGIFAISAMLSQIANLFYLSVTSVSLPVIADAYARGGIDRVRPLLQTITKWAVTVTLPVAIFAAMFAGELLSVFGPEFVAGSSAVLVMSLQPLANSAMGVSGSVLLMTGHARLSLINSIVWVAAAGALDLLLIPELGILGAALAATAAQAAVNLLRLIEVYALFRIHPYNREIVKPIAAGALAAAAAWFSRRGLPVQPDLVRALLGLGVTGVTFVVALLVMGLSEADREVIQRVRTRLRSLGSRG